MCSGGFLFNEEEAPTQSRSLLPVLGVLCFNSFFCWAPPGFVGLVPFDGVVEAVAEVLERWLPAGFFNQLGVVDCVALIVAWAVIDVIEIARVAPEFFQDHLGDLEVVEFAVGTDQVGFAKAALVNNCPHGGVVVTYVDPVADLFAGSVDAWADAVHQVGDGTWDELFDVLVWPVVVRAVGDGCFDAEGAYPGAHEVV